MPSAPRYSLLTAAALVVVGMLAVTLGTATPVPPLPVFLRPARSGSSDPSLQQLLDDAVRKSTFESLIPQHARQPQPLAHDQQAKMANVRMILALQDDIPNVCDTRLVVAGRALIDPTVLSAMQQMPVASRESISTTTAAFASHAPRFVLGPGVVGENGARPVATALFNSVFDCQTQLFQWLMDEVILHPGQRMIESQRMLKRLLDVAIRQDCVPIVDDLLRRYSTLGWNGNAMFRPLIETIRVGSEWSRLFLALILVDAENLDVDALQQPLDPVDWTTDFQLVIAAALSSARSQSPPVPVPITTALALAISLKRENYVQALLHRKADVTAHNAIAWQAAMSIGDVSIAQMLLDHLKPYDARNLIHTSLRAMSAQTTPPANMYRWLFSLHRVNWPGDIPSLLQDIWGGYREDLAQILRGNLDPPMVQMHPTNIAMETHDDYHEAASALLDIRGSKSPSPS